MSSKALLNVNATIAMAHGMTDSILDKFGMCFDSALFGKLMDIQDRAMAAFGKWPEKIDNYSFRKLSGMIGKFSEIVNETQGDITAITSLVIAMLEQLKEVLCDRRAGLGKIVAISELLESVCRLHFEFDPEYSFDDGYVAAALLQQKWNKIIEGN